MRILQVIDSLDAGGAERMAVNYANALANEIEFSGLIATRKEGALVSQINSNVEYLFLKRENTFDIGALLRLVAYVKTNNVTIIQAHSTSIFIVFLLKIFCPKIRLIWHDHYGNSDFLENRKSFILKKILLLYSGIIVVNQNLRIWANDTLKFSNVIYLPNFATFESKIKSTTFLKGKGGNRILCLANLRPQKNHFLLVEVAKKIINRYPDWTFHLVGKDFNDEYSNRIKNEIFKNNLQNSIFLYDSKLDIEHILNQSTIGILSSNSEGLPLALLEYGLKKMPIVTTAVGEIPFVITNGENGLLVEKNNVSLFYNALEELIENVPKREELGVNLHSTVLEYFSEEKIMDQYLNWLQLN